MTRARSFWVGPALVIVSVASGCTCTSQTRSFGDGAVGRSDAAAVDGALPGNDALAGYDTRPNYDGGLCGLGCAAQEDCGSDGTGNGLDDDCNGQLDDGCEACVSGNSRECYNGFPPELGRGACHRGLYTCGEFGWTCSGDQQPRTEVCNGVDDNCDGTTDEGLQGCSSRVQCPSSWSVAPLANTTLRGADLYSGSDVTAWQWSLGCPPTVANCPTLGGATTANPTVFLPQSGQYSLSVMLTFSDGSNHACTFPLATTSSGLRVELDWATASGADLDLHLHRFTSQRSETDFFHYVNSGWDGNTCFYADRSPNWGLAQSPAASCADAPQRGSLMPPSGPCPNPRIDIDTNAGSGCGSRCFPENINVDNPEVGKPYRVMVNYYASRGAGQQFPTVNIYCNGAVRGVFGGQSGSATARPLDISGLTGSSGAYWLVADVVFEQGQCGLDCRVYPVNIYEPATSRTSIPFGPEWSCTSDASQQTCTPR